MTSLPPIAVVAGSGIDLRGLLDNVRWEKPFSAFQSLASVSVAGHSGVFLEGMSETIPVIVQQGRCHFYEGLSYAEVTAPVQLLASLGVERIVFTNAAGGLKAELEPGCLMAAERIETWPYRGWPNRPREIVPQWLVPECDRVGTYMWVHGPSYETRAEIAALERAGISAVGMSTAPEMACAHALGLRTAAISCITNNCLRTQVLSHAHVVATAERASEKLCAVLRRALPYLAECH